MSAMVSNDIFSYEKEVQQEGNLNNLLHAVMTHEQRSLRGGYLRAVALVEAWTEELLAIDAQADGAFHRYIGTGVKRVAGSSAAVDAVVLRDTSVGRIVHSAHAGNLRAQWLEQRQHPKAHFQFRGLGRALFVNS